MMESRELQREQIKEFVEIYHDAYPGPNLTHAHWEEMIQKRFDREDMSTIIAVDENDRILGGLKLIDYTLYQKYNQLPAGGIGGVCVSLDAKKRGVAKFLMEDAVRRMKEAGKIVSILYPFRQDFYNNMGWGQVGELKEFRFKPASLELYPERQWVRRYQSKDLGQVKECYEEFARQGNCLAVRKEITWENKMLAKPSFYVYEKDGKIEGYIHVSFQKGKSMLSYDMVVKEMVNISQEAYFGLLGFIASQFDQVENVTYYTHSKDPFHHLLKEPRREEELFNLLYHYSQRVGIGWMFRVLDVEKALIARLNYNAANLEVTFVIEDSFCSEQSGSYLLTLIDGKPKVVCGGESSFRVKLDISTFSQFFAGYLSLQDAMLLRKAEVSDESMVSALDHAFNLPAPRLMEFF